MLKEALLEQINSAALTAHNHSLDNSFIDTDPAVMERNMRGKNIFLRGFCLNVPFNHYVSDQVALVYESDGELYWVHFPQIVYRKFLSSFFGRETAKSILKKEEAA